MSQEDAAKRLFDRAPESWTADRVREAEDWWWLTEGWGQELRQLGDDFRGFSISAKANGWLLTIRLIHDGQPQVVFINRKTTSGCVSKAREKWAAGTLAFFADRYA